MLQGRSKIDWEHLDPEQYAVKREAVRVLNEYVLHLDGMSYVQQGYTTPDGQVFAWKMDEHLLCDRLYQQAVKDKRGRQ